MRLDGPLIDPMSQVLVHHPFVQRMLNDSHLPPQPVDISLGEQTTNEMCLEIFGLAVSVPAGMATSEAARAAFQLPAALGASPLR